MPERRKGVGGGMHFQPPLPTQQTSHLLWRASTPIVQQLLHLDPGPAASRYPCYSECVLSSTGNSWKLMCTQNLRPRPRPTEPSCILTGCPGLPVPGKASDTRPCVSGLIPQDPLGSRVPCSPSDVSLKCTILISSSPSMAHWGR